jgi:hypothetical protein
MVLALTMGSRKHKAQLSAHHFTARLQQTPRRKACGSSTATKARFTLATPAPALFLNTRHALGWLWRFGAAAPAAYLRHAQYSTP